MEPEPRPHIIAILTHCTFPRPQCTVVPTQDSLGNQDLWARQENGNVVTIIVKEARVRGLRAGGTKQRIFTHTCR
jgi:hypothetical protein